MPQRTQIPSDKARRPGDEFAAHVADLLAPLGPVQVIRLFSGHGFKLDGVQFAMILRGTLYLRVDDDLRQELEALGSQPFGYQTAQRSMTLRSYYSVPADRLDEAEAVLEWAQRARGAALANARRKGTGRKKAAAAG